MKIANILYKGYITTHQEFNEFIKNHDEKCFETIYKLSVTRYLFNKQDFCSIYVNWKRVDDKLILIKPRKATPISFFVKIQTGEYVHVDSYIDVLKHIRREEIKKHCSN